MSLPPTSDTTATGPGSTAEAVADELRDLYPPILTSGQVAEMLQCTVGDVLDKTHRGELQAVRWGQQFRFFRLEVLAALRPYLASGSEQREPSEEGR